MAAQTLATLRNQFAGTDPAQQNIDLIDTLKALIANLKFISIDGRSGAGACTATGAAVGDVVVAVVGITAGGLGAADASFEASISVANQVQQTSAGNLSANDYIVILSNQA